MLSGRTARHVRWARLSGLPPAPARGTANGVTTGGRPTVVIVTGRDLAAVDPAGTFVFTWNNLLWPLLAVTNPKLMTIPVGLATVQGSFGQRNADILASAILGALPLICCSCSSSGGSWRASRAPA
jgi:hypothetical protein